jgi:hypothetical protein
MSGLILPERNRSAPPVVDISTSSRVSKCRVRFENGYLKEVLNCLEKNALTRFSSTVFPEPVWGMNDRYSFWPAKHDVVRKSTKEIFDANTLELHFSVPSRPNFLARRHLRRTPRASQGPRKRFPLHNTLDWSQKRRCGNVSRAAALSYGKNTSLRWKAKYPL